MNKCAIIVTTYNRLELLKENIKSLLNQTYKKYDLFVINNASTDDTEKYVLSLKDKRIKYFNTGKNLGGAGGFSFGLKKVLETGVYDYAWIMDDDSIPVNTALESLINSVKKIDNNFSYLASLVYWTDNQLFPMNIPSFENNNINDNLKMISEYGLIEIKTCSFVGCFINLEYAEKAGLPIADFFIYGDDIEYTTRLNSIEKSYLDLNSVIIHKAPSNVGSDIVNADFDRISRFYYQSRNGMYNARKNKKVKTRLIIVFKRLAKILLKSKDHKFKRIHVLIKGTIDGFKFNPKIEFVNKDDNNEKEIVN